MSTMDERKAFLRKHADTPGPSLQQFGEKFIDFRALKKWDIPEYVVVGVAPMGVFIDRDQNPHQPMTTRELVKEFSACVDLGAVCLHMHVRDDAGKATADPAVYRQVIDPLRARYGPNILVDGGTMTGKTFEEAMSPVTDGLFDLCIVNPSTGLLGDTIRAMAPPTMRRQAEYYRLCGVKPLIDVHEASSIDNAKRYLIDTGLVEPPTAWHILAGLPGTMFMPHPRAMAEGLLFLVNRIREIDPGAFIFVSDPGRAGIYMSVLGILMGLHVRLGMEDTIWEYPHLDNKIKSNADVVRAVVEIARHLGRRPATAAEFRKAVGIA
jgi:3-keto-5-aminohexanoate cleavage enzyme